MENTNFLWKFLVTKGLEQYIMIAVVISEWFHLYVLTPFIDSVYWVSERTGQESDVMGRLRAAGANSLMGHSILGAYPADLPPPHEAGDASGLIDLARKYGYGDWSDDGDLSDSNFYPDSDEDEDENDDDDEYFMDEEVPDIRRKRSSTSSSTKKKKSRKRRSSQQELGVSFDFDLSSSSSQGASPPLSDINTRRREEPSISGSLSSAHRRRKSNSGRPRSRLPYRHQQWQR